MDALEPLLQRDFSTLRPTDYDYTLSFVGEVLDVDTRLKDSISSIMRIADELGRDYEIIVTHRPLSGSQHDLVVELRKSCPALVFLESNIKSHGQGKKVSFEYSTGKFIIPFNTGMVYPVQYSDILHNFLKFKLKRLFYSELPLVSREIINEVGGWRDLFSGEDIDLFSRISINYGVFAFPTGYLPRDDATLREILSIRKLSGNGTRTRMERYRYLRDLIISCNHSFNDVRNLSRILKSIEGETKSGLLFLAYLGSKFSRIKPVSYNRNNYVILMESILESLILKEYLKLPNLSESVAWQIDRAHIRFLTEKSKLFKEMNVTISYILKDQL